MKIKLIEYQSVKSTNDVALRLINKNESKPTLIFSKNQTKGRGTMGKKWISKKGNLFLTVFFEMSSIKTNFKELAILNAFLFKNIISKYVNKRIDIKWPNDLLIEKKKICGILQEVVNFKEKKFLIVGVGINTTISPYIHGLKSSSIKDYAKKNFDNKIILKDIKKNYEKFIDDIMKFKFLHLKRKLI